VSAATRRSPSRPGGDAPRRSRSGDANRRSRSGSEAPAPAPLFAFLRAVNLGKVNKVPMAKLMELLAARGFPPTGYLLASGNLAVQAPASDAPELRRELVRAIAEGFDVRTEVVFKTAAEVARLVREEPLRKAGWPLVYVSLWDSEPDPAGVEALSAEDFSPDALRLVEGAAYMGYAASSHDARLTNALLERRLKVPATARNVNTLERLLARFAPPAG